MTCLSENNLCIMFKVSSSEMDVPKYCGGKNVTSALNYNRWGTNIFLRDPFGQPNEVNRVCYEEMQFASVIKVCFLSDTVTVVKRKPRVTFYDHLANIGIKAN